MIKRERSTLKYAAPATILLRDCCNARHAENGGVVETVAVDVRSSSTRTGVFCVFSGWVRLSSSCLGHICRGVTFMCVLPLLFVYPWLGVFAVVRCVSGGFEICLLDSFLLVPPFGGMYAPSLAASVAEVLLGREPAVQA